MIWIFNLSLMTLLQAAPHSTNVGDFVAQAMREPHQVGLKTIKTIGPQSYSMLEDLAFNEKWPMQTRWKSFMLLTQAQGKASLPLVKKALLSKVWYMRSAGLTALQDLDPQGAKKWAYQLLNSDPALMVRMKAVEILKADKSEKVTELFWKKVYSADSLHRQKSLWIRGDLVGILAEEPRTRDLQRWVQLLHDQDGDLRSAATVALAKLHKENASENHSVAYWLEDRKSVV